MPLPMSKGMICFLGNLPPGRIKQAEVKLNLHGVASKELVRPSVIHVVKRQRGGSQNRLVLFDDGKLYVLKMHPNPPGNKFLANETLGANLFRRFRFLLPASRPITINL